MFGGFIYPDGQMFVDHIEPFIEFQKAFLLKLQKMRETNVFTYPVMTYNLVYRDGKFQDEEFARWLSNHNRKWADANFLISAETTSAASCCFDGSQLCYAKIDNKIIKLSFKEMYEKYNSVDNVLVEYHGQWNKAKVIRVKLDKNTKLYSIKTAANNEIKVTDNHIVPTKIGDKIAESVEIGDLLPARFIGAYDDFYYDRVVEKTKYNTNDEYVYCFEIEEGKPPYFMLGNGIITHNCRLVSNFKDLKGLVLNSIGGSSLDIGSVVVTTLNLAGYAEQAKDENDFIRIVKEKTGLVIKINDVVRDIIKRNIEKGLLPNYSYDLMKLSKQMNTVGVIGFPEAAKKYGYLVQDEFGYWNYTDEGIEFGRKVLNTINETKDSFDFDYSINLEQVPAENCAVKLAYANSLLYGTKEYILGNQWIPLKDKASIKERTKAAGIFDRMCGGGAITHIQIDAPIKDEETAWNLLNYIAKQGVIYFAFNLKINVDEEKHTFTTKTCPICGEEPVDTYQRCVGYLVPTKSWSEGRKRELSERDWMNLNDPILS